MVRDPSFIRASRPGDWPDSHHESGHAVAACVLGVEIEFVQLLNDLQGSRARVRYAQKERSERDVVVVALAGPEAERKCAGFIRDGADSGDLANVRAVMERLPLEHHPAIDDLLAHYREEARDLVRDHWEWISAVATALRRHRILGRDAIEELRPAGYRTFASSLLSDRKETTS